MSEENQQDESPATLDDESPNTVSLNRLLVAGGFVGMGLIVILLVIFTTGNGSESKNQTGPPATSASAAPTNPQGKTFMNDASPSDTSSSYQPSSNFSPPQATSKTRPTTTSPASQQRPRRSSYRAYGAGRQPAATSSSPSPEERRFQEALNSDLVVVSGSEAELPSGGAQRAATGDSGPKKGRRSTQQQVERRLRAYRNAFGGNQQARSSASGKTSQAASMQARSRQAGGSGSPQPQTGRASRGFQQRVSGQSEGSARYQARVQRPKSQFELKAGTVIPAVLMTAVNSQLPGSVVAQVSRDVYDSQSQNHLLIPKGSRLIGAYDDQIALGQSRAMVAWSRLIFPDGRSIQLPGLNSKDLTGTTGMSDEVNRHYMRIFGSAALLSAIGAGFQLSQPKQSTGFGQAQSPQQVLAAELGRELSRVATEMIRRNMDIQPTVKIRKGYRFYVFLSKDLALPAPYREARPAARFTAPERIRAAEPSTPPAPDSTGATLTVENHKQ